jgi:hypothetical protein
MTQPLANKWVTIIQFLLNIFFGFLAYRHRKRYINLKNQSINAQEKTAEEISRVADKDEIRTFIKEILRPLREDLMENWNRASLIDQNIGGSSQIEHGPFNELNGYDFDPSEYIEELENLFEIHDYNEDMNIARKIQKLDQACCDYQRNRERLRESLVEDIKQNAQRLVQQYDSSEYDEQPWRRGPLSSEQIEKQLEESPESFADDLLLCTNPDADIRHEFKRDILFPHLKRRYKYDIQELEDNQDDIHTIFEELLYYYNWSGQGLVVALESKLIRDYGITIIDHPK